MLSPRDSQGAGRWPEGADPAPDGSENALGAPDSHAAPRASVPGPSPGDMGSQP